MISPVDHPSEREADKMADAVMRGDKPGPLGSASDLVLHKSPAYSRARSSQDTKSHREAPGSAGEAWDVEKALRVAERGGTPLNRELRGFFETCFGQDFSRVRVHCDNEAAAGARAVGARAYTFGHNIVFGSGQFAPSTADGRHLLAHEMAHVAQQSGQLQCKILQRSPASSADAQFDEEANNIRNLEPFKKLERSDQETVEEILAHARKSEKRAYYLSKLKLLLNTPYAVLDTQELVKANREDLKMSSERERAKLRDPDPAQKQVLEKEMNKEEAASASGRVWKKQKTESPGGPAAEIDNRDPLNIVGRVKVRLVKAGLGTDLDIEYITSLEDAIEKAASMKGFTVDLIFVTGADPEAYEIGVDPSTWTHAGNWGGGGMGGRGSVKGLAHELLHLFGLPDRYDYIERHAANRYFETRTRLVWFLHEMQGRPGIRNPASLMALGSHPTDQDACEAAELPLATCVPTRMNDVGRDDPSAGAGKSIGASDQAFLTLMKKYSTFDERILNCIVGYSNLGPDDMMKVLRQLFQKMSGSSETKAKILKRAKSNKDIFGKVFHTLKIDQQQELLQIIEL